MCRGGRHLYATTKQFLSDLNLRALDELPPLVELGSLVEPNPHSGELNLAELIQQASDDSPV